jgi:hypothetical protein
VVSCTRHRSNRTSPDLLRHPAKPFGGARLPLDIFIAGTGNVVRPESSRLVDLSGRRHDANSRPAALDKWASCPWSATSPSRSKTTAREKWSRGAVIASSSTQRSPACHHCGTSVGRPRAGHGQRHLETRERCTRPAAGRAHRDIEIASGHLLFMVESPHSTQGRFWSRRFTALRGKALDISVRLVRTEA